MPSQHYPHPHRPVPRYPSSPPSPSQPILLVPSDDEPVSSQRHPSTTIRRSGTRWSRLLHIFQLPYRRRANSSATSTSHPFHSTGASHMSRPVSVQPSISASRRHPTSAHPAPVEIRRARRERSRFRPSHSRTTSSSTIGGPRSRRTMSDGALRQTAFNSPASSTTSISQASHVVPSPSQQSRSAMHSTRTIFMPVSTSMRFRRPANTGGDGASATSIAGVASAGSGLSDSDESSPHEDALQRLHSIGSGAESGSASVASEGREGRTSALVRSALADLDAIQEHDLFAMVNRIFDDYPVPPSDAFQSSAVYLSRHPAHVSHRLAMRVRNTYYSPGRQHRRGYNGSEGGARMGVTGMHNHHDTHGTVMHGHAGIHGAFQGMFGMDDRDIRVHMIQPVRVQEGLHGSLDNAASDAQIEALPSFVMEKGETRSVKEIFESMRNEEELKQKRESERQQDAARRMGQKEKKAEVVDKIGEIKEEEMERDLNSEAENTYDGTTTTYTECAICLCDFEAGDEITALPCGHFFHLTGCVREWLAKHARTCPTCRADICLTSPGSGSGGRNGRRTIPSPSVSSVVSASEDAN